MTESSRPPGRLRRLGDWLLFYLCGLAAMAITVMAFAPVAFRPFLLLGPSLFLVLLRRFEARAFRPIWWGGMSAWGGGLLAWIGSLAGAESAGRAGWLVVSAIFLLMSWPFLVVTRRLLRRGLALAVAAPLAMTAFDAFRHLSSRGLSWHDLGYALADWNALIQVAELASVYPLSALVWAGSGYLADIVLERRGCRPRSRRERRVVPIVLALAFVALLGFGHLRRAALAERLRPGPAIAGLQTAIPQAEKLRAGESPAERRHRVGLALMREAFAEGAPDLVVWPETSFFPIDESSRRPAQGASLAAWLRGRRRSSGTSVAAEFAEILGPRLEDTAIVIGALLRDDMPAGGYDEAGEGVRERNAVLLLRWREHEEGPAGFAREALACKMKLVPFGEYVPFPAITWKRAELHRFLRETAGYLPAMTPGEEPAVWSLELGGADLRVGVNVCYEAVFPALFRAARERGAELFVNVSNDAWYDDSAERELVNEQVRFRAIENRAAIFRVSNTGISVSMDPLGREAARLDRDRRGVLADRPSLGLGAPWGLSITPVLPWLLVLASLSAFLPRRRNHKA